MEKKWLRDYRLFALGILIFSNFGVFAQNIELKPSQDVWVGVDVEVPIVDGNVPKAKEQSQKVAFEKALNQVLPQTMDSQERAARLKNAGQAIKSFRVTEEKREENTLRLHYECEVVRTALTDNSSAASPVAGSPTTDVAASNAASDISVGVGSLDAPQSFEISWNPSQAFSSADFYDRLEKGLGLKIQSFRFNRGGVLIKVKPERLSDDLTGQLVQIVAGRGTVKKLETPMAFPAAPLPLPAEPEAVPMTLPQSDEMILPLPENQ